MIRLGRPSWGSGEQQEDKRTRRRAQLETLAHRSLLLDSSYWWRSMKFRPTPEEHERGAWRGHHEAMGSSALQQADQPAAPGPARQARSARAAIAGRATAPARGAARTRVQMLPRPAAGAAGVPDRQRGLRDLGPGAQSRGCEGERGGATAASGARPARERDRSGASQGEAPAARARLRRTARAAAARASADASTPRPRTPPPTSLRRFASP